MVQLFFTYRKTICHRFLCHIDPGKLHFNEKTAIALSVEDCFAGMISWIQSGSVCPFAIKNNGS
jgi:hypothetical protein